MAKPDVISGNPPSPSLPAAEATERMAARAHSGPASVVVILMVQETRGQFAAVSYYTTNQSFAVRTSNIFILMFIQGNRSKF